MVNAAAAPAAQGDGVNVEEQALSPQGDNGKAEAPRRKIPPQRVDCSDCVVYVGRVVKEDKIVKEGTPYRLHEGGWVDVIPVSNMREFLAISKLGAGMSEMGKDIVGAAVAAGLAEQALDDLCDVLAERVIDWDWTDNDYNPLPSPHKNPSVFRDLISSEELLWLVGAIQGETEGQRKND